ncbi:hypothetical protein H5410_004210 [Solanum commersonii]|uniref:Uncharacterized protein n=1 Tax=Solanum commersonii TaxID=4109 RepID=A0A9J6B6S3_SOLCO|nr:hypothetical protein H5410_004210 [Solanum commersonii]
MLMVVQFNSGAYLWTQGIPLFLEDCVHNVIVLSVAKENSQLVKTEWPIFVDLQLGSPPVGVEGEKHSKSPILLSDDE